MNHGMDSLNGFSSTWAEGMSRACWQGGLVILLIWALCRALTNMPPAAKCWLWRLAYLKLLVALVWATPIGLPLLPAPRQATVSTSPLPAPADAGPGASESAPSSLPGVGRGELGRTDHEQTDARCRATAGTLRFP